MDILQGLFVIEGLDGSGKTTLAQFLASIYPQMMHTMQPSFGPFGVQIRELLKKPDLDNQILLDLFIKDRTWHQDWIIQNIQAGHQIILDRYMLSTLAYQGLNFSQQKIWDLNQHFKIPQITFFIDLPPEIALERKIKQMDLAHQPLELFETKEKQEKIWQLYQTGLEILKQNGYSIVHLDGTLSPEELLKQCQQYL